MPFRLKWKLLNFRRSEGVCFLDLVDCFGLKNLQVLNFDKSGHILIKGMGYAKIQNLVGWMPGLGNNCPEFANVH